MNRYTCDPSRTPAADSGEKRRRGLTLIELLAATVAVALLVAALTPAMAGARRNGKQAVCLQNLARIAEASIVYATADPDDQAVPIHPSAFRSYEPSSLRTQVLAAAWGGKSGQGPEDSDVFFWGTLKGRGPATRPLNKILYGDVFPDYTSNPGPGGSNWARDASLDLSVFRCPADGGYAGSHYSSWRESGLSGFDHYGSSYIAGRSFILVPGDSPNCKSNSVLGHALGDIVDPARTIYYFETCAQFAFMVGPQGDPGEDCGTAPWPEPVVWGWHRPPWQFNAAFVDGHAATIHMRGFSNPRLGRYPESGGFPDPYQYWRCVIIRGGEWQLDTLPLPPVEFDIPCP
ncbi:MAG: prepilin-type N-terminal cleavage/methylation domain-containing protein [bacterium]|nr:prepilin-type N-terminal cleavage/methylation domain-containing protein [bacterium]